MWITKVQSQVLTLLGVSKKSKSRKQNLTASAEFFLEGNGTVSLCKKRVFIFWSFIYRRQQENFADTRNSMKTWDFSFSFNLSGLECVHNNIVYIDIIYFNLRGVLVLYYLSYINIFFV